MASPDLKTEQGSLQTASQVAQAADQVVGSSVLMEDVNTTERMRIAQANSLGMDAFYNDQLRQLNLRIAQNVAFVDNIVNTSVALSAARSNESAERDQGVLADAQINDPAEAVAEAAVLKAGQIDGAVLAAINAAVAAAVASALNPSDD